MNPTCEYPSFVPSWQLLEVPMAWGYFLYHAVGSVTSKRFQPKSAGDSGRAPFVSALESRLFSMIYLEYHPYFLRLSPPYGNLIYVARLRMAHL